MSNDDRFVENVNISLTGNVLGAVNKFKFTQMTTFPKFRIRFVPRPIKYLL